MSRNAIIRSVLLLIACALLSAPAQAGQDVIFSQFFSSPLYLNPAFAGSEGGSRLVFNSRAQPFGGPDLSPVFNFSYDGYLPAISSGIGLLVTSDMQGGLLNRNQVAAIYTYHVRLADDWYLQFGAQAGYHRVDLNAGLEFADPSEPLPDFQTVHAANFAAGLLLYGETFYGGMAAHHLAEPKESFFTDGEARLRRKYTAHLGMYLRTGDNRLGPQRTPFTLSPNVVVQHQAPFTWISYGLYAGIEPFIAGVWLRQDLKRPNTLVFLLGMEREGYRIGYSYDYSLSGYSGATHGIHEISVGFFLGRESKKMKYRILNCPSF